MFLEISNEIVEAINELTKSISELNSFDFLKDFCVPMFATLLGCCISFLIAWCTIKADRKQAKQEYLDRIKPLFTVEDFVMFSQREEQKTIVIPLHQDYLHSHNKEILLLYFYFTNVSENIGIIKYLKLNDIVLNTSKTAGIKSGETFEFYMFENPLENIEDVHSISIGVLDIQLNLYEYEINFKIEDKSEKSHNELVPISIDCTSGIVKSKENTK